MSLRLLSLSTLFVALALLACAPAAQAAIPFGLYGEGAGQTDRPEGIAVDQSSGDVFVVDRGNNRVSAFESDGTFLRAFGWGVQNGASELQVCTATCQKGLAGSGAGQFSNPTSIAIDSAGDLYIGTDSYRVQKFTQSGEFLRMWGWDVVASGPGEDPEDHFEVCVAGVDVCKAGVRGFGAGQFNRTDGPLAVGPGDLVYAGDRQTVGGTDESRIERFEASGALSGISALPGTNQMAKLAIDSSLRIYATYNNAGTWLDKYEWAEPQASLVETIDPGTPTIALGVDPAGNLYAFQSEGAIPVIAKYDPSGNTLVRFGYGEIDESLRALAPYESAGGHVFGSETSFLGPPHGNKIIYLTTPDPVPVVQPGATTANPVGNTKATLNARINPEGLPTTYRIEYLPEAAYLEEGGFSGPQLQSSGEIPLGSEDFFTHAVSAEAGCADPESEIAEGKCLKPGTAYRFQVVATNAEGSDEEEGPPFTTRPTIEVTPFAKGVGTDTAILGAEVNPLGLAASGYFEYVTESQFQASGFAEATRVPDPGSLDFGAGEAPVTKTATLYPLSPGTAYRYRLAATNIDPDTPQPIHSQPHSFTTFAPEAPEAPCPNDSHRAGPSALLPDCRAYELVSPLEKENGDIVVQGEFSTGLPATLNQSSTDGSKLAYGSYRAFGDAPSAPFTSQYVAERGEGSWQSHAITPPRERINTQGAQGFDTEVKALSPDLCTGWLRTVAEPVLAPDAVPGYENLYRRADESCGPESYEALTTATPSSQAGSTYQLELQGLSADGQSAIYLANDALPATTAPPPGLSGNNTRLYERDGSGLRFACVLPNGSPIDKSEQCSAGTPQSGTGMSRINTLDRAISTDGSRVFWSAWSGNPKPGKIYVRIGGAQTKAVSAPGEAASGSLNAQFWGASADGSRALYVTGGDLYEADVDAGVARPVAAQALGVMGASSDLRRIYFASEEALTGPNAEGRSPAEGEPNLYLEDEGALRFVGTLSAEDVNGNKPYAALSPKPDRRASRVSADGLHAAFTANGRPTGYDNADAANGKAAAEVYLYDATANGGQGELVCVSCNPGGGRPAGGDLIRGGAEYWAAAQIPVWQSTLYASKALSADGHRLYFEATDSLVARDTNGLQDVYQWERAGTGSCEQGAGDYVASAQGCIRLISDGLSKRKAELTDASADGSDVFFTTVASLLPQDYGLVDVYDARVEGGQPIPELPEPQCEAEACRNPASPPQAITPSSNAYRGPGNLAAPKARKKARRCPKGKRKVRVRKGKAKGRVRCVKRKRAVRKRHRKHRRHSQQRRRTR